MPNRPQSLPKYRHYKPKDLAVVRIDGRDHYLGRHGSPESWERYHRLLAERASTGLNPPVAREPDKPSLTVVELSLAYWRHARAYYRRPDGTPAVEQDNIKLALRPLRKLYGFTQAGDFGPVALKVVRAAMVGAGLSRTTINQRVGKIVRVFRWAVENELVPPSAHHALSSVPGLKRGRTTAPESKPVRPVLDADVDAVRPFCTPQVWAMIELQRLTAARSGEIVTIRTSDVDRGGDAWVYRPREHKTEHHGHHREIILGPKAQAILTPWLRADPEAFLFRPRDAMEGFRAERRSKRQSPMTPSQETRAKRSRSGRAPGERYDTRSFAHAVARACDRAFSHPTLAEVPAKQLTPDQVAELKGWRKKHRWHPHRLRHSAATAIRARYGLEAAQVILGHAKADVTQLYAERNMSRAVEVMLAIG